MNKGMGRGHVGNGKWLEWYSVIHFRKFQIRKPGVRDEKPRSGRGLQQTWEGGLKRGVSS